jgi:hypothetical protein
MAGRNIVYKAEFLQILSDRYTHAGRLFYTRRDCDAEGKGVDKLSHELPPDMLKEYLSW